MALNIRRVVTGHDETGKAVVQIDETSGENLKGRPGVVAKSVWMTDCWPINNADLRDGATLDQGHGYDNRTKFRVVEYAPGCSPRRHRTQTIDYAVVLSGQIDMELDGSTTTLKAGDVLVQRGTIHDWINRYANPCVIAFVLIGADLVDIDGILLRDSG